MTDSIKDYANKTTIETILRTEILAKREELYKIRDSIASDLAEVEGMIEAMDNELGTIDW